MSSVRLRIFGRVQGVGFRPFIYNLAIKNALKGAVFNQGAVVVVEINNAENIQTLITDIRNHAPELSFIESIEIDTQSKLNDYEDFMILPSKADALQRVHIPTDLAMCASCEAAFTDPKNRRFAYPFISCTQCGPRYSIISTLPFDRVHTSMQDFPMCEACQQEYDDPQSRYFHAQTLSCKVCGPKLSLLGSDGQLSQEEMIDLVVKKLESGAIVAVKGVGGYQLLCDATNAKSISTLRERKQRPQKPFAVMVQNIERAKDFAILSEQEKELLLSKEAPIVLVVKKTDSNIALNVADENRRIGLFLPYTPLHKLLLDAIQKPLIATSANVHGEPLAQTQKEILKMDLLWDYCLDHDRRIINACDDSVVFTVNTHTHMIRHARGYAPQTLNLSQDVKAAVLAVGANQKSSIALAIHDQVVISPYIGDLESVSVLERFEAQIESFYRLYSCKPELIVCDEHPGYLSHKWAHDQGVAVKEVQHHHAHILSVMHLKKIEGDVLGLAFDGTGYGKDKTLWGGEFLKVTKARYERVAHLKPMKLLGGDKAIKEPRRMALSLLFECLGKKALALDHPAVRSFTEAELQILWLAFEKELQTPLTSSMGRLFDAVASLANVCQIQSFEGQSGITMELYYDVNSKDSYPFTFKEGMIDYLPMIEEMVSEREATVMITKFFNTVLKMIEAVTQVCDLPLVCSGGVFQNPTLIKLVEEQFPEAIFGDTLPSNDEGIALGQIAAVCEKDL